MSGVLVVHKSRTNIVTASLGYDVSTETLTSEIRSEPDQDSELIVAWTVTYTDDGTDGELTLTITDEDAAEITARRGYMDIKRVSGTGVLPVFDKPLEVEFRGTVTV